MPATTTTTELIAKSVFTLLQVQAQRDLRIQAGAIRSTIDASDPVNYILTTEWNIIGGNDDDDDAQDTPVPSPVDDSPHVAPGTGHALTVNVGLGSDVNITNLATVLMSEASIGNDPERASVGFTVVNRLKMFGKTAVDQVWSAYAHNQAPTAELVALARQLLAGQRVDITKGATHFYSPRSMPKEGDATGGFDVGGGLELVPPLQVRTFAPSWIKTMQLVEIDGVRPAFYKFYRKV
jgi:hypothetical protein